MLINAIWAENLKSRHSKMWVAVVILPLITAAIGAVIYGINASAHLYGGAVWQQLCRPAYSTVTSFSRSSFRSVLPTYGGWSIQTIIGTA